jgi:pyridoxal phosphate enzyme (YggS family)
MTLAENVRSVTARIEDACARANRNIDDITLVCVTKEASAGEMEEALRAGITDIGESRVQDARTKYNTLPGNKGTWHLIGHLQRNKARDAVKIFDFIHSVDSLKLAQAIHKEALKQRKLIDILLEVNVSGEKSKFGIRPEQIISLVEDITALSHIRLLGLMTMAPLVDDPEKTRPYFKRLKRLFDDVNKKIPAFRLEQLSMGMTQDFEVAIEEGATMVRIGRAIFKGK